MTDAAACTDDAGLVEAARTGDRRAFEQLLVPLLQPAYRIAFNMLGNRDEADDAVQQAALNAWRGIRRLRKGTATLRPWFLAIVVNECRTLRRGRWWRVLRLPEIRSAPQGMPDLDRRWDLRRALDRLPARQRLLLYLYFCSDLPFEEIGPILRISPAAARARLYRITRGLRPQLEHPGGHMPAWQRQAGLIALLMTFVVAGSAALWWRALPHPAAGPVQPPASVRLAQFTSGSAGWVIVSQFTGHTPEFVVTVDRTDDAADTWREQLRLDGYHPGLRADPDGRHAGRQSLRCRLARSATSSTPNTAGC